MVHCDILLHLAQNIFSTFLPQLPGFEQIFNLPHVPYGTRHDLEKNIFCNFEKHLIPDLVMVVDLEVEHHVIMDSVVEEVLVEEEIDHHHLENDQDRGKKSPNRLDHRFNIKYHLCP